MSFTLSDICNVFHFTEKLYLQKDILYTVLNGGLTKTTTNVHLQRQKWYYSILYCGTEHCMVGGTTVST